MYILRKKKLIAAAPQNGEHDQTEGLKSTLIHSRSKIFKSWPGILKDKYFL